MGVYIYGAKLGSLVKATDKKDRVVESELEKQDVLFVFLENKEGDERITEFESGYYIIDGHSEYDVAVSYSSYDDFFVQLNRIQDEDNENFMVGYMFNNEFYHVMQCGIENVLDYKFVENMVEPFDKFQEAAERLLDEHDLWIYNNFKSVVKYVVENKGVMVIK